MMNQSEERPPYMPLKRVVCVLTGEAEQDDDEGIQKAVRSWHNRMANGTVPKSLFIKIGRYLFMDVQKFEDWLEKGGSSCQWWDRN